MLPTLRVLKASKIAGAAAIATGLLTGCAGLGIDHALTIEYTGDTRAACLARAYQAVARREARAYGRFVQADRYLALADATRRGEGNPAEPPARPSGAMQGPELAQAHAALTSALARWREGPCACADAKASLMAWTDSTTSDALDALVPSDRIEGRTAHYQAAFTKALGLCTGPG